MRYGKSTPFPQLAVHGAAHQTERRAIRRTCPASLVRSVRIVELTRDHKHKHDSRQKHRGSDDNDPGALNDHFFLRSLCY